MPVPISFTGAITTTPALRTTSTGHAVANFTVTVTDSYHHHATGTERTRTLRLPVTAWRDLAHDLAGRLTIGDLVKVTGELRQRGRNDALEIEASTVEDVAPAAHTSRGGGPHLRLIANHF